MIITLPNYLLPGVRFLAVIRDHFYSSDEKLVKFVLVVIRDTRSISEETKKFWKLNLRLLLYNNNKKKWRTRDITM